MISPSNLVAAWCRGPRPLGRARLLVPLTDDQFARSGARLPTRAEIEAAIASVLPDGYPPPLGIPWSYL